MGSHQNRRNMMLDGQPLRLRQACKGKDLWLIEQKRKRAPLGYYVAIGRAMKYRDLIAFARALAEIDGSGA